MVELASASREAPAFEELATAADPMEGPSVAGSRLAPPAIGTRVGWRGPLIAVGTAVAIFAVVAASMLLIRSYRFDVVDEPAPTILTTPTTIPTTQPSPATTVPATEPSPATTVPATDPSPPQAVSPVTWSRIDDPDIARGFDTSVPGDPRFGGSILALASTDHGWMVGGHSDRDAAVWISTDTSDWAAGRGLPKVPLETPPARMAETDGATSPDLPAFEGRTVAVGFEDLNRDWAGAAERRIAAVWYTDDGETWHRVEHDPDLFAVFAYSDMRAVTATSVWVRCRRHRRVDLRRRYPLGPARAAPRDRASQIIATEQGLIAAGTTGNSNQWGGSSDGLPAVWTSVDGVTWNPAVVESTPSSGPVPDRSA